MHALCSGHGTFIPALTGSGKSAVYQVLAILNNMITIVVVPLVALVADIVEKANDAGIGAAGLYGPQVSEQDQAVRDLACGHCEFIVANSEKYLRSAEMVAAVLELHKQHGISHIVIDEAHMIHWNYLSRPDYLKGILKMAANLPGVQLVFMSATLSEAATKYLLQTFGVDPGLPTSQVKSKFDLLNRVI